MYDVENQIIFKSKETEDKLKQQYDINEKLNSEISLLNKSLNDHKNIINQLESKVQSLLAQQSQIKEEIKNEVDEIKKKFDDEIVKLKSEIKNLKSKNENLKKERNENLIEIQHQNGKEFQGIFKYLTDITGGNIHDNQTLCVSSNSICSSSYHPKNLLNFDQDNIYHSENIDNNAYIRFDFKEKSIQLFSYTIKSYDCSNGNGALRSWVIEVSNDETNWQIVDQHSNDSTLNGSKIVATFNIQNRSNNFYRFIQLRRTGPNWHSSSKYYYIYFYCFEIYGKLKLVK